MVAEKVYEACPGLDYEAFIVGNLAPDSGTVVSGKYNPSRKVTHFKDEKDCVNPDMFIESYIEKATSSFHLGYLSHLITDRSFTKSWYKTYEKLYGPWGDIEKDLKRDVLDERFHWDFVHIESGDVPNSYHSFMKMNDFEYDFDVFEDNQIEKKMIDIQSFYRENSSIDSFDGILLNRKWIKGFADEVSLEIVNRLAYHLTGGLEWK